MTLHVAFPEALLVVADGSHTHPLPARAECLAVADGRLLVGTREGLYAGRDPARLEAGGLDGHVTALAVGPAGTCWAGTEPSAVHRSTDGGRSWAARPGLTDLPSADRWSFPPRPDTHHVRWVEPDPAAPDRLYVAVEAGALVRTDDGGATWRDRTPDGPRDTHSMATHPDRPGVAWAAAGDGFAVTADGGDSWRFAESGLGHTYCWSVAVDPGAPDRLLCSAASGASAAHRRPAESYLYRRVGDGDWERASGLPTGEGVTRAVLAADGAGACYAASNAGVHRTADWGETWERVADAPADAAVRGVAVG
ncbi:MAG: WD40/YVTN/BNR-like repeat-containing protein [Haloferacaceae archaeon]